MIESFIGAFSNAVRGGQFKPLLAKVGLDKVPSDAWNAFIFSIVVFMLFNNVWLAVASFPMMWLGASFGWGAYIGSLGLNLPPEPEVKFIDPIISSLKSWPRLWGFAGLMLRGILWGICLGVIFIASHPSIALIFILMGATMPMIYGSCYAIMSQIGKPDEKGILRFYGLSAWSYSEWVFGAMLWSAL